MADETKSQRMQEVTPDVVSGDFRDSESDGGTNLAEWSKYIAIKYGVTPTRYSGKYSAAGGDSSSYMNSFNRYGRIFPNEELENLITFVFIVRPDCNIDDAINRDPFFYNLALRDQSPIFGLSQELNGVSHHFIPFLVDRVMNYSISDFNVKTYDFDQPFSTFKTVYTGNSNESRSGDSFDITFRENNKLDVTMFFESWVRYMDGISTNRFIPKRKYIEAPIIEGTSIIDYATSIYMFKCDPTAREILYYHKRVGAVPTVVPHSNWSYAQGGSTDNTVSIQFSGAFPEALNPRILAEFNYNAGVANIDANGSYTIPTDIGQIQKADYSDLITGVPYVTCTPTGKYYLRWKKIDDKLI